MAGCPLGDLDGDCDVGFGDLIAFSDQWLDKDATANLDGISKVNMDDFALFARNWLAVGGENKHEHRRRVTVASMCEPVIPADSRGYRPLAYDSENELILTRRSHRFYKATFDGARYTLTLVFDMSVDPADYGDAEPGESPTNPMYALYVENKRQYIQVAWAGNGVWLVNIGGYFEPDPPKVSGATYRSTDQGATWTQVHTTCYGYFFRIAECDGFIAMGEYNSAGTGNNYAHTYWRKHGCNVYVSYDDGLNWDKIAGNLDWPRPSDGGPGAGRHVHAIIGGEGDEVFAVYGDAAGSLIRYLVRPKGWEVGDGTGPNAAWTDEQNSAGDWIATDIDTEFQPNDGMYEDGKFFVTCSGYGNSFAARSKIISFDKNDDWRQRYHFLLQKNVEETNGFGGSSDSSGPYIYAGSGAEHCRKLNKINGLYYTSVYGYSTDTTHFNKNLGLYVSADTYNWTALYRDPSTFGPGRFLGVWNGTHMIYECDYWEDEAVNHFTGFFPLVSAELVSAQIVSKGYKNLVGATDVDNSIFANSAGSWRVPGWNSDRAQVEWSAPGEGLFGGRCLKVSCKQDSPSHNFYVMPGYLGSLGDGDGGSAWSLLREGTFVTWSAWVRRAGGCPNAWMVNARIYGSDIDGQSHRSSLSENWARVTGTLYVYGANPPNTYPRLLFETPDLYSFVERGYADDNAGLADSVFYIDGGQLFYHTDRWLVHSQPLAITGPPSTGVLDDRFIVVQLAAGEGVWSLTFDWFPMEGRANFPHVPGVSSEVPICSVEGTDGSYIDLRWARDDQKFEIIDDGSTIVQLTGAKTAVNWLYHDIVKFALCSDGTDTELYMFMPENLKENGSMVLTVTGTAVNLDIPVRAKLGTNNAEDDIGCGAYANVRFFHSQLTPEEVTKAFNSPPQ